LTTHFFCVTNILDPAVLAECGQTDGKVGTRNLMPYNKPKWTVSSLDHNEKAQVMMGSTWHSKGFRHELKTSLKISFFYLGCVCLLESSFFFKSNFRESKLFSVVSWWKINWKTLSSVWLCHQNKLENNLLIFYFIFNFIKITRNKS